MNRSQFNEALEKLERAPAKKKVLCLVLAGHTDTEIAVKTKTKASTVRKQISKIYTSFDIKGEYEGDRRPRRDDLVALFRKYKPELVGDLPSAKVTEQEEAIAKPQRPDSAENLPTQQLEEGAVVSDAPNSIRSEQRKDWVSLATSLLAQHGFDKKFEENRTSQYIGYRLKHPGETDKRHQLVLFEKEACVGIAIPQGILSQYLLEFKFNKEVLITNKYFGSHEFSYFDLQEFSRKYWVRPSKEDVFFEISKKYNKILGGQSRGTFHLDPEGINPIDSSLYYQIYGKLPEFKVRCCKGITKYYFDHSDYLKRLDNSDCCLRIVDTDNFFPYTWQVSINSSEVLEEFIGYFAKVLMEVQS